MDHVREIALQYAHNIVSLHTNTTPEADTQRLIDIARVFEAYLRGNDRDVLKDTKGK